MYEDIRLCAECEANVRKTAKRLLAGESAGEVAHVLIPPNMKVPLVLGTIEFYDPAEEFGKVMYENA